MTTKIISKNKIIKGRIIDLRDNAGGLLSSSVEVADLFLSEGLIAQTQKKSNRPVNPLCHSYKKEVKMI